MKNYSRPLKYARYIIDEEFRIVEIDDTFTELTGYTKRDIEKKIITHFDLLPKTDIPEYSRLLEKELEVKTESLLEHRIETKRGDIIYVYCLGMLLSDKTSEIRLIQVDDSLANNDLEEKMEKKIKRIKKIADTDNLTGALRRTPFENSLNELLDDGIGVSFLILDIDSFKGINDKHGHQVGDKVLVEFTKVLKDTLRKTDLICRLGGDEFVVYLNDLYDTTKVIDITKMLLEKIRNIKINEAPDLKVTSSIGVAIALPNSRLSYDDLYKYADDAVYVSKNNGKDTFTVYEK